MKGLRPFEYLSIISTGSGFLPCDLNEGITTDRVSVHLQSRDQIFTLWPEWRDYDHSRQSVAEAEYYLIFTLWPEWRDYDRAAIRMASLVQRLIFTLWPEWRDYDSAALLSLFNRSLDFYLVTWMKGLRPNTLFNLSSVSLEFLPCDLNEGITTSVHLQSRDQNSLEFLPCDLNEGITTSKASSVSLISSHFYLVTWMKGLRLYVSLINFKFSSWFLPCDLNEGITTRLASLIARASSYRFLPCDLNEGITTRSS